MAEELLVLLKLTWMINACRVNEGGHVRNNRFNPLATKAAGIA
jgi:hypothetical protein